MKCSIGCSDEKICSAQAAWFFVVVPLHGTGATKPSVNKAATLTYRDNLVGHKTTTCTCIIPDP